MNYKEKNGTDSCISNCIDVETRTTIKTEFIPMELKSRNQWLLFKLATVNGKLKKYPFTSRNRMGGWNLAKNQSSFEIAYRTFTNNSDYSGIGYVIVEHDPFTCIDFDHVYNPTTEEWNQQALEEIKKFNSYTEFSPSGTGVHLFVKGKTTKPGTRKEQPDGTGREMYSDLHYMTVTGNHVPGTPLEINEAQEIIDELYEKWFPDKMEVSARKRSSGNDFKMLEMPKSFTSNPNSPLKGLHPTKNQVIELCKDAPSGLGAKFSKIFNGDISKYESKSEADMALAGMIAFHTSDCGIIKEIIHESALWDNKWERDDYCQRTIMTAIRNRGEIIMPNVIEKAVYKPEGSEELGIKNVCTDNDLDIEMQKSEEFSSIEEIIEYATRNNKDFKNLFTGKCSNKEYSIPRDAEKALIRCLMTYTQNCKWILEILNKSTLKRTKWNEDSYLQDLVNEVLFQEDNEPVKQTKPDVKQDVDQDINEDIDLDERRFSKEILDQAEAEALRILATDDPIDYILKTVEKMHVGDKNTQEGICISIGGQSCSNTDGIQISINGKSGTGKSNAVKKHLHLVPARYKRVTNVSSKALYYMELRLGMDLFFDDKDPDPALEDVFKRCTTNYQEDTVYNTVKDQGRLQLLIPPRINWYFTSVESHVTTQMLNRQLLFDSDTSAEQDQNVFYLQRKNAKTGKSNLEVNMEVLICRRIYAHIKDQLFRVKIPFADRIELKMINDRRVFPMLLDIIKGYAVFKYQQRTVDEDGCLIADLEDFYRAKRLFEAKAKSVITHLNENEHKIIHYIFTHQGSIGCTYEEIANGTEIPYKAVQRVINGRKDRTESGLIEKYNGLDKIESTESKFEQETRVDPETGYESTVNTGSRSRKVTRVKINAENINPWEIFDNEFVYLKE